MTTGTETPLTAPGDEARELRRPRDGRMVAGVAAGLAAYFGLRPAIYRIAFAALALVGGAGILLYAVAALVIPAEGADESIAEEFLRRHRDRPALLVGLGVVGVLVILLVSAPGAGDWGWPLAGPLWFLVLLGIAGVALWRVSERDRETLPGGEARARPRAPSLFLPGLGVLLAAAGLAALLDTLDVLDVPLDVALATGLVIVGVLVAVGAVFHRRAAGLALLGLVLALALAGVAAADLGHGGPVGDRTHRPLTLGELDREYNVRIGRLELDLRGVELGPGDTLVELNVGIGELVAVVPDGVAVDVTADARAGDVNVLGRHDDGWQAHERVAEGGLDDSQGRLVLDAEVGFGEIDIRRAGD
jgi:phage shock protein PspC (stress-responsive transcriptional regulator)